MNIGEKVKLARISKKISVYRLSRLSGVTEVHIHQIEKGITKNPGILTLSKLSRILKTTIDELIN